TPPAHPSLHSFPTRRSSDLRPTALILSNILGHIPDYEQARGIVTRLMAELPSGSYLSINDGSRGIDPVFERAQDAYNESGAAPYILRSVDEIDRKSTRLNSSHV